MSLKTAIQFRFLAAQLTQSETHQFVNKLIDGNSNIIINALFNQILNTSANQQSEADNINNTISNIIQSRKKKPKPIASQNIKLVQLPKQLIGVTSSFLDQNENINFSKTNRWIYLGCNSPNLLQKLDLTEIENYSYINLSLYPSVKDLTLHLNKFNELIPAINGLSVMNGLEAIELNGEEKSDIDIDNFLQFKGINVDNITELRCTHFGSTNIRFPSVKFMKLLTKFANIQYLDFYGVIALLDAKTIKDLYPNLKGLSLNGGYDAVNRSLIQSFGNNLDFLALSEYHNDFNFNLQNTNFNKLEELELMTPTIKSINNILLTAKNLKKVRIDSSFMRSSFMTRKETKKTMTKFMTICKSLQYVLFNVDYVADDELLESALDGIENGLFETKKWKRNPMKIHIYVKCNDTFNPNDFTSNIEKIIHWLEYSEINDFMFIFSLWNLSEKIDKNVLLQGLKSKCLSTNAKVTVVKINSKDIIRFIITNVECKIIVCESFKMCNYLRM